LQRLTASEIQAAMLAYKSGERSATVMDRIARGFSDQEIANLAAWLGQRG
jgi:cytochrome c553